MTPPPPSSTGSPGSAGPRPDAFSPDALTDDGPWREITEDGTEYLVTEVTAQLGDAVYAYPEANGRPRYEYLPGEELTANLDQWDGEPLVLRHPSTPDGGFSTADDSRTNVTEVGQFRNPADYSTPDTLRGQVYIRVNEVGAHGGDLQQYVEDVDNGAYGEVSTGYVPRMEWEEGRHNGQPYEGVQRDLQSDHLALLPDRTGNCSVAEGCGVGRFNAESELRSNHRVAAPDATAGPSPEGEDGTRSNVLSRPRTPSYSDTSSGGDWSRPSLDDYIEAAYGDRDSEQPDDLPTDVSDLPQTVRRWIAMRSLLGDPEASNYDELLRFPVVGPDDALNEDALDAVLATIGSADVPNDLQAQTRSRAYDLLEDEFGRDVDRENAAATLSDEDVGFIRRLRRFLTLGSDGEGTTPDDPESSVTVNAALSDLSDGTVVSWSTQGDRDGYGRVRDTIDEGEYDGAIDGDTVVSAPAALVEVFEPTADGWESEETMVAHKPDALSTREDFPDASRFNADADADSTDTETTPAESGVDSDSDTSRDTSMSDKTETLVEEHGFDRENLPDEDEDCFDRIYDKFTDDGEADADTDTDPDGGEADNGTDGTEGGDGGDADADPSADTDNPDAQTVTANSAALEQFEERLDTVEEQNEKLEEQNTELREQNEDLKERIDGPSQEAVDDAEETLAEAEVADATVESLSREERVNLAATLDDGEDDETEGRSNYAGRRSADKERTNAGREIDVDVPAGGYGNRSTGGDD